MNLSIHYNVLRLFGYVFLGLFVIFVIFSAFFTQWPGRLLVRFVEFAFDRADAIAPTQTKEEQKRNRKLWKREHKTREFAFKVFCWAVGLFLLISLFLPKNFPYRVPDDWYRPLVATGIVAAVLVIFVGSNYFEGQRGWRKWTFWVSAVSTTIYLSYISHWYQPRRSGGFLLLWIAAALIFAFIFGALRRISLNENKTSLPEEHQTDKASRR
jgi:hypothetical protein